MSTDGKTIAKLESIRNMATDDGTKELAAVMIEYVKSKQVKSKKGKMGF